ncbi:hypothetical protein [Actinoplanes sp. NPDC049681]|uniref:hypothetical protein n=1 Tax=Actinoplanes sp. NPDC049681 TaxID=3363905 RepID=UPI00379DB098
METPRLPEPLRARAEALAARSPLETVRDFLRGHVTDADDMEEIRSGLQQVAQVSTRGLDQELAAVESVLAEPLPDGTLARLIGWDANWVLDDPSDAGAAAFLRELADMIREVLAAAR